MIAWTEHHSLREDGATAHAKPAAVLPGIIRGFEVIALLDGRALHLVVLGADPDLVKCVNQRCLDESNLRDFISDIHDIDGGAVLVNNADLQPDDIDRLAALGVDGFEIANLGHPVMSDALLSALVAAQEHFRIALVSVSDWHGWGGLFKTWTIFRDIGANEDNAREIVDILRHREIDRVVPVVAHVFGPSAPLRAILAPVFETVRYASGLSASRVASWWVWAFIAIYSAGFARKRGLNPLGLSFIATSTMLGFIALLCGKRLIGVWLEDPARTLPLHVGSAALASGVFALVFALFNDHIVRVSVVYARPALPSVWAHISQLPAALAGPGPARPPRGSRNFLK